MHTVHTVVLQKKMFFALPHAVHIIRTIRLACISAYLHWHMS